MTRVYEIIRAIFVAFVCCIFHRRHWGEVRANFNGRTFRCRRCGEWHFR